MSLPHVVVIAWVSFALVGFVCGSSSTLPYEGNCQCTETDVVGGSPSYGYCKTMYCKLKQKTASCFPLDATVMKVVGNNGHKVESVSIGSLQEGDIVLAMSPSGNVIPSPIWAILHHNDLDETSFVSASCGRGHVFEASPEHLVYYTPKNSQHAVYGYASSLEIGDSLWSMGVNSSQVEKCLISSLSHTVKKGYSAPVTAAGTIIVNGASASCYASFYSHSISHVFMSSVRILNGLLPSSLALEVSAKKHSGLQGGALPSFISTVVSMTSQVAPEAFYQN